MLRKILVMCLVLAAGAALSACSGGESPRGGGSGAETYTVADEIGDWGYPSPYGHYARGPGYIRMSLIFDTLVWKDSQGHVPALAEDWSYDEEENVYTFTLRDDVTWHDGEKFDSSDVVFTFEYIKEHPYNWVDGSKIARAVAEGPYSVKIYPSEPYAPFLDNIAGTMPILPEHIYREADNPQEFRGEKALVGTGPFKLLDYSKEHGTYLYESNPTYYGGIPLVEQLRFVKLTKEMVGAALERGEVNAAGIPPETVQGLEDSGINIIQSPYEWVAKIIFNHQKAPFSNREFRQALAFIVNRQAIVDIALRGHGEVAAPGMLPAGSPWYNADAEQYGPQPEKAREIMEGLGYEKSADGIYTKSGTSLVLELLTSARFSREAELIRDQLEQAGIRVNIRTLEAKTVDSRILDWQFDIALTGHGGMGGDPEILNKVILDQDFNSARYTQNSRLTELLESQVQETDRQQREQMVKEVQQIYAREIPALSIYHPAWYWGHDGLVNLYYTPGGVGSGVPIPLNKLSFIN